MSFKIILADDHPLILAGIRSLITQSHIGCDIVAEAHQVSELLKTLQQHSCDLLITDFSMPGDERCDGLAMIQQLRREYPELPIIVLTQIHNAGILQSLAQSGVRGIILKKAVLNELTDAIRQIKTGQHYIGNSVNAVLAEAGLLHQPPAGSSPPGRTRWYACLPAACRSLRWRSTSIAASRPSAPRKRAPCCGSACKATAPCFTMQKRWDCNKG